MKIAINSFIFLAYILLAFPYQTSSASIILNYEKEMGKIKVIANKVMKCESPEGKHNIWGDLNYPHKAYGILQFQKRTFIWLSKISGKKGLHWKNEKDQKELFFWAVQNGYGKLWTCYRILNKRGEFNNGINKSFANKS